MALAGKKSFFRMPSLNFSPNMPDFDCKICLGIRKNDKFIHSKPSTATSLLRLHRKRPIKLRLPGFANGKCPELSIYRLWPFKKFVHSSLKQAQPTVKILGFKRNFLMQIEMFLNRIAPVCIWRTQQEKLPKSVHNWKMMGPIDVGDVIENEPNNLIRLNLLVERINQGSDVGRRRDIGLHKLW